MVNTYLARGAIKHVGKIGMALKANTCINRVALSKTFETEEIRSPDLSARGDKVEFGGKREYVREVQVLKKVDLILDARAANEILQTNKQVLDYLRVYVPVLKEMQDMSTNLELARQAGHDFFGKLDMISAYSQIPLPEELQGFTSFRLGEDIYCFTTLPFGLAISGHVFTLYFTIHLQIAKARFLARFLPDCVRREERDEQSGVTERINNYLSSEKDSQNLIAWRHLLNARPKKDSGIVNIQQANIKNLPQSVQAVCRLIKERITNSKNKNYEPVAEMALTRLHVWISEIFKEQDRLLKGLYYVERMEDLNKIWTTATQQQGVVPGTSKAMRGLNRDASILEGARLMVERAL